MCVGSCTTKGKTYGRVVEKPTTPVRDKRVKNLGVEKLQAEVFWNLRAHSYRKHQCSVRNTSLKSSTIRNLFRAYAQRRHHNKPQLFVYSFYSFLPSGNVHEWRTLKLMPQMSDGKDNTKNKPQPLPSQNRRFSTAVASCIRHHQLKTWHVPGMLISSTHINPTDRLLTSTYVIVSKYSWKQIQIGSKVIGQQAAQLKKKTPPPVGANACCVARNKSTDHRLPLLDLDLSGRRDSWSVSVWSSSCCRGRGERILCMMI